MLSSILAFFALNKLKIFAGLGIIALVGAVSFAGYKYVGNLQDKVVAQAVLIAEQKTALLSIQNALEQTKENFEAMQVNLDELAEATSAAEQGVRDLRTLFADHDLTNLAYEKPGLIERRINDGTDQVLDDLRELTLPR